jgi:hypothetical protein
LTKILVVGIVLVLVQYSDQLLGEIATERCLLRVEAPPAAPPNPGRDRQTVKRWHRMVPDSWDR